MTHDVERRSAARSCHNYLRDHRRCVAGSFAKYGSKSNYFYCASVTRCYPGRAASGRGDRAPTPNERRLCRRWRESELALLRPKLIVTVGGLAARELLGLERVTDFVGSSYDVADAVAVPLPHPSGASGWLNAPANRARLDDALALVAAALARL